jgi:putative flippase GtrA
VNLGKLLRYSGVSVIATAVGMTVLGVLVGVVGVAAGWANVMATATGTVPSFELNRRWVWGKSGQRSMAAEIVPFCVMSFAGLALSTAAVHAVAAWGVLAIEVANVSAFGSLWVLQFIVLDRVLFGTREMAGVA